MTSRRHRTAARAIAEGFGAAAAGRRLASGADVPVALVVGRSLALICHPQLAWHRLPSRGRAGLAVGYAVLSYLTALVTLFALRG